MKVHSKWKWTPLQTPTRGGKSILNGPHARRSGSSVRQYWRWVYKTGGYRGSPHYYPHFWAWTKSSYEKFIERSQLRLCNIHHVCHLQGAEALEIQLGTIHKRRRQFFWIFNPPPPYRQYFSNIHRQFWPIFDPSPTPNCRRRLWTAPN